MKADNSRIEMNHPARLPSAKSSTNSRVIRGAEITYVAIQLTKSKDPDARPILRTKVAMLYYQHMFNSQLVLSFFFFTPPGHFLFAPIELLWRHKAYMTESALEGAEGAAELMLAGLSKFDIPCLVTSTSGSLFLVWWPTITVLTALTQLLLPNIPASCHRG
jgi:hypothetical protein